MSDRHGRTRQTIILAAGNGSRLAGAREGRPKPLVTVGGRALIEHAVRHAESAGCEEAVIVVGHGADQVQAKLESLPTPLRLRFAFNPDYDQPNGVSLLAAEPFAAERFFLQMADHVFTRPVLGGLDDGTGSGLDDVLRLLVDPHPKGLDETDATKVQIRDGLITAIGKDVSPWDAIDAGCFRMDRRVFDALRADVDTPRDRERANSLLHGGRLAGVAE
jgi:choline kinase